MGIIANLTPITGVFLASLQIMAFFFTKSCNQALGILSTNRVVKIHTLPETNSLPLKIGHPKRKPVFQPSTFRCYDSFREGNVVFWGPSRQRSSLTAAKKNTAASVSITTGTAGGSSFGGEEMAAWKMGSEQIG